MSELEEKQESTHTVVIALCECVVVCVGAYNVWNLCVCVCVWGESNHTSSWSPTVTVLYAIGALVPVLHAVSVLALASGRMQGIEAALQWCYRALSVF